MKLNVWGGEARRERGIEALEMADRGVADPENGGPVPS
jgi:hypothetical protein